MDTASLELCKELHELSGWGEPGMPSWCYSMKGRELDKTSIFESVYYPRDEQAYNFISPQYTLGYLIRKLPQESQVDKGHFQFGGGVRYHAKYSWNTELPNRRRHYATESADTPEDAACALAIELFKQNILKK